MSVVLDTETVYRDAFKKVMEKEYGVKYDEETHKAVVGLKTIDRCKYIVKKFGLKTTADEMNDRLFSARSEVFSNCKFKPGAERLVTHLHASKVPLAVATGTGRENYDVKTKPYSAFFGLFHHVVNAGSDPEVPVNKPDPRIFVVCARRFEEKPHPRDCLVFEDSSTGLLAATRVDMQVVLIPELDYSEEEIKDAALVIKSLEDFKPEEFSLPPYPSG